MFSKIAINNVKRSFKDYSIYFLTLTVAVCIFYSFNSIEAQTSLLEISKSTKSYMITLNKLIAGASIFVSFILGGLIIYANNFLIKKRKKELGIYMTLGMSKGKISRILILETFFIGLLSLAAGILLSIIVSQGLSVITAKLLVVDMNKYKFVISVNAIIKSTIYFGIIFFLVMIFNQIIISKYKLIDMINAAKKNEDIKLKNPVISVFIFILSAAALIVFIGIYLGIVFLIASAAVLALQQLSEASDSLERYNSLKKIGATEKMINKAILIQNLIYFMVPLALAIIHSMVGVNVANEALRMDNKSILESYSLMLALTLTVIYGGYFYATFIGFKSIVKNSN